MQIAEITYEGVRTIFEVTNDADVIQSVHKSGRFYELHQLVAHRNLIPLNCTVIDCGANVGNHTLFYARHTLAERVYALEANPHACRLLQGNVAANPQTRATVDLSHIGVAIGAKHGTVKQSSEVPNNLGAMRFGNDQAGKIPCVPLDAVKIEGRVAFIKIDVEGMEMEVLAGAETLIQTHRSAIAIEVDQANEQAFWSWARGHKYAPVAAFFDYVHVRNYLMIPT